MSKYGRRRSVTGWETQWTGAMNMTSPLAPFGTHNTPAMRMKIIAGKAVMVPEDQQSAPKVPQSIDNLTSRGRAGQRRMSNLSQLPPLAEKHDQFDATPFVATKNARNSLIGHTGLKQHQYAQSADSYLNRTREMENKNRSQTAFNPHPIVPPIATNFSTPRSRESSTPQNNDPGDLTDMLRHLPHNSFMPVTPVTYPDHEELQLRRHLHADLKGCDPKQFQETYTMLTGYDRQLTGYINLQDLTFTLSRNQINVNTLNMRLVAAMCVMPHEPTKVNYEKVLSFLASSQRNPSATQVNSPATDAKRQLTTNQPPTYRDRENAKLLRYLEEQLKDSSADLDLERCWNVFLAADRSKQGLLEPDRIKKLVYSLGIPLQDSLIMAIIDKCDYSNGQVNWEQFLEFITRVAPRKAITTEEGRKEHESSKQRDNRDRTDIQPEQQDRHAHSSTKQEGQRSPSPSQSSIVDNRAWLKRFMDYARAVYACDTKNTGTVKLDQFREVTVNSNYQLNLDLPNATINRIIRENTKKGGMVDIHMALREFGTQDRD